MGQLVLNDVRKSYEGREVVHGINLDVASGQFVVVVGPSGCGKSTLLRMIAGLEDITSGEIEELGGSQIAHCTLGNIEIAVALPKDAIVREGDTLPLAMRPTAIHLFDTTTGKRIEAGMAVS
jgi:ABC-type sugar transport system ATPase subunit